jgi:hypothetical protein
MVNFYTFNRQVPKKCEPIRIIVFFTQNIVTAKIWPDGNPGSEIPDMGPSTGKNPSRIPGSKRHQIPDPQHWRAVQLKVEKTKIVLKFFNVIICTTRIER